MEPRRETTKRATASASKQPVGKRPQEGEASEASTPPPPANQQAGQQTGQQTVGTANQPTGQHTGAQHQNQDLLQHAKQAGGEIVNQVQQQAGTQIERQKETAANELSMVVNAVRQFGQNLSGEASGPIARYAAEYGDKAANSLERLSNYIREQDARRLLNDVQNFGRRQPALLLGGAFLLGFAGARLIRSSMEAASHGSMSRGFQSPYETEVPSIKRNAPVMGSPGSSTSTV